MQLQKHKKTALRAEFSLGPKCSLEVKTPNHHVGNCKIFELDNLEKTAVHNVVTKCNINKLAAYLNQAGRLSEFDQ